MLGYRIEGDGKSLLLIHGMGVTYTIWENLVPLLKSHYKLIMVEMPGHGESPALAPHENFYQRSAVQLEELRQALNIDQWMILGYSMGAWAAQYYLQYYPDRVSAAIFLCPGILTRSWSFSLNLLVRLDYIFPGFSRWLLKDRQLHLLVKLLGFNGHNHPYVNVWAKEIGSQPFTVIKALLRDMPGAGRAPFPIPFCPTMFIWGADDSLTERPRELRPIDYLVKGWHSAPMLAADEIASAVLGFGDSEPEPQIKNHTSEGDGSAILTPTKAGEL